jgi:hypothetical protein
VKPKNKRQKDLSHSQGNEGYDYGFWMYIQIIICTMHNIMTFAFINIHLDIYRIIIIILYRKGRCFGYEEKLRRKRKFSFFVVYEKKEGVFCLRLKSEVSLTSKEDCTRIYYKVCTNLHKFFPQLYYKDFSRIFCRKVFYSNC